MRSSFENSRSSIGYCFHIAEVKCTSLFKLPFKSSRKEFSFKIRQKYYETEILFKKMKDLKIKIEISNVGWGFSGRAASVRIKDIRTTIFIHIYLNNFIMKISTSIKFKEENLRFFSLRQSWHYSRSTICLWSYC